MAITLELNHKELELLLEILEDRLGTMREQVYHAESPHFRDQLKAQKITLNTLLDQVRSAEHGLPPRTAAL